MKIIKFLRSNFQVLNFFLASVIVGVSFGLWYSTKSFPTSSNPVQNQSSDFQTNLTEPSTTNANKELTMPESLVNSELPQMQKSSSSNLPTPSTNNHKPTQSTQTEKLPALPTNYPYPIDKPTDLPMTEVTASPTTSTYLGHFSYQETPQNRLVNMGKYYHRNEYLDQETAQAFIKMKADAKAQGVELVLMSGFRTISSQQELFNKQIQKRGSKEAAAKLSAPPGHSEHHTGYAVDLGDGKQPEMDFKFEFEYTQAYKWLANNAHKYGFELSFPRNNPQGVSFEPWHWRYVSSSRAQKIFAIPRMYNQQN